MKMLKSSIEHPSHPVPEAVAVGIHSLREKELAELARLNKITKLARPNEEERRVLIENQESAALASGINAAMQKRNHEVGKRRFDRIVSAVDHDLANRIADAFDRILVEKEPPPPPPTDSTFWWARTDWDLTEGFSAQMKGDGLHFVGAVHRHNGDLHTESFGVTAYFELQRERIPKSPSGRWVSTPHVELFGKLLGQTANIFGAGDCWSKCWMYREQQLYQYGFREHGGPTVLGEANEFETLLFEENTYRGQFVDLRGFQWMPQVTFGNINPMLSLWASVKVRFDIQTEGDGALLALYPEILLRTFQWQLTPL